MQISNTITTPPSSTTTTFLLFFPSKPDSCMRTNTAGSLFVWVEREVKMDASMDAWKGFTHPLERCAMLLLGARVWYLLMCWIFFTPHWGDLRHRPQSHLRVKKKEKKRKSLVTLREIFLWFTWNEILVKVKGKNSVLEKTFKSMFNNTLLQLCYVKCYKTLLTEVKL